MHSKSLRIASLTAAFSSLSTVLATNFDVAVGPGGNLVFYPEYVTAQPGDTVNFVLCVSVSESSTQLNLFFSHPKNHTVTQSSFDTVRIHQSQLSNQNADLEHSRFSLAYLLMVASILDCEY